MSLWPRLRFVVFCCLFYWRDRQTELPSADSLPTPMPATARAGSCRSQELDDSGQHHCLPGSAQAGNWNWECGQALNPDILAWDMGVPTGGLTAVPNACASGPSLVLGTHSFHGSLSVQSTAPSPDGVHPSLPLSLCSHTASSERLPTLTTWKHSPSPQTRYSHPSL